MKGIGVRSAKLRKARNSLVFVQLSFSTERKLPLRAEKISKYQMEPAREGLRYEMGFARINSKRHGFRSRWIKPPSF